MSEGQILAERVQAHIESGETILSSIVLVCEEYSINLKEIKKIIDPILLEKLTTECQELKLIECKDGINAKLF
jgi:hypothetical protein